MERLVIEHASTHSETSRTRFELTADGLLTRIVGPKAPSDSGTVARIARPILLSAIARDETDDCR